MAAVTEADVETFWRDGVVCLRGVMPVDRLAAMAEPLELALTDEVTTDLSALGDEVVVPMGGTVLRAGGPRGQFRAGTDHWTRQPEFAAFALDSPLPRLAATVLRSQRVWLYEDSVLVKEPGTSEATAFHQDLGYFHLRGEQVCTTWVPLDPITTETGAMSFVRGSHRWNRAFRPNWFVSQLPMPDTEGEVVPDIEGRRADYDIVTYDLEPGDVTVHHARTLHGAAANTSETQRRRAISVRYCGDDARYQIKRGAPTKPHHGLVRDGDPVEHELCPLAYPRAAIAATDES